LVADQENILGAVAWCGGADGDVQKALEIMGAVWEKSYTVQMKRLSEALGFELENGIPKALLALPKEKLLDLLSDLGRNWLAGDGIWFQAVEARRICAKRRKLALDAASSRPGRSGASSASRGIRPPGPEACAGIPPTPGSTSR
jgi:hypothetical protein